MTWRAVPAGKENPGHLSLSRRRARPWDPYSYRPYIRLSRNYYRTSNDCKSSLSTYSENWLIEKLAKENPVSLSYQIISDHIISWYIIDIGYQIEFKSGSSRSQLGCLRWSKVKTQAMSTAGWTLGRADFQRWDIFDIFSIWWTLRQADFQRWVFKTLDIWFFAYIGLHYECELKGSL